MTRYLCVSLVVVALVGAGSVAYAQSPTNPSAIIPDAPRDHRDIFGGGISPGLYGLSSSGPAVLYSISTADGSATPVVTLNGNSSLVGLSFLASVLYGSDLISYPGGSGGFDVGSIDPASGVIMFVSDQDGSANWHGLGGDDTAGVLYAIDINDSNNLKTLDAVGTVTTIGPAGIVDGRGMAYDDTHGILYATGEGSLYTVNTGDGSSTLVGPMGIPTDVIGLAYDEASGTLYANVQGDGLYTVDTGDGSTSFVGSNGVGGIDGLAWFGDVPVPTLPNLGLVLLSLLLIFSGAIAIGLRRRGPQAA